MRGVATALAAGLFMPQASLAQAPTTSMTADPELSTTIKRADPALPANTAKVPSSTNSATGTSAAGAVNGDGARPTATSTRTENDPSASKTKVTRESKPKPW